MKTLHLSIIVIVMMAISLVTISHFASGFQQGNEQSYPLIDVPKIMSVAENSTEFIEKTDRYDHYLLAKATLRTNPENTGNATQEEYELVYALYRNHGYCYFENLLAVTLDDSLKVTSIQEYSLSNEPAGYPQPPMSCLMNLEPPKMDYNPLLIILAPSPFATVNETFNASSDDIVFSGTVHKLFSKYITLSVFNPHGDLIAISQPQPEPDGTFSQTFQPFSPLWSMTGNYTVSITSGTHNLVESPFYFSGVGCCMTESPLHYADQGLPPLEQWKSYVPARNTICAKDLQLVIKAEDGSPACVKSRSAAVLILHGWARESVNGEIVYFMKSNSTGRLTVKYNSAQSYGPTDLNARIYNGSSMYQIHPSVIEAEVNPSVISGNSNTTVVYTIMSHETKGVYWLSLDVCRFVPIAVDFDNSQITNSDLQLSISGLRCPVSLLQYKIVGFEGIEPEYVRIGK